jgi:hypothetical protein
MGEVFWTLSTLMGALLDLSAFKTEPKSPSCARERHKTTANATLQSPFDKEKDAMFSSLMQVWGMAVGREAKHQTKKNSPKSFIYRRLR